jgi:hypothetical protein
MFLSPFARKENFWTQIKADFQDLKAKYPCTFNGDENMEIPPSIFDQQESGEILYFSQAKGYLRSSAKICVPKK